MRNPHFFKPIADFLVAQRSIKRNRRFSRMQDDATEAMAARQAFEGVHELSPEPLALQFRRDGHLPHLGTLRHFGKESNRNDLPAKNANQVNLVCL